MTVPVSDVTDIVRTVLRDHRDMRGPDELGRVWCCTCGWWQPGTPWATHLIDVLTDAGIDLDSKATA